LRGDEMVEIILGMFLATPIVYLAFCVKFVNPNEIAAIYRLDRFQRKIKKSGFVWIWAGIEYLVKFPSGIQTTNLVPENVLIAAAAEGESQPIVVACRQPLFFNDINKIVRNLGARNKKEALFVLFGKKMKYIAIDKDGHEREEVGWKGGLAGSKIAEIIRKYVASDEIKTLDEAYQMREKLGGLIFETLKSELKNFGFKWSSTIIDDVSAAQLIIDARTDKAQEFIAVSKAKLTAEKTVNLAKGEADAKRAVGKAEADVNYAKLEAKLKIINDSIKIASLKDGAQLLSLLLFGTEITGSLKDMGEMKLFLAPNLNELLGSVLGGKKSAEVPDLIKAFIGLNDQQKIKIAKEIKKWIGDK
ncbi:hypothetical protein KKA66_02685, partial [Patescibacteria group bacterium]|nr:hypothetical protein [Patescibacteria group bacterium]